MRTSNIDYELINGITGSPCYRCMNKNVPTNINLYLQENDDFRIPKNTNYLFCDICMIEVLKKELTRLKKERSHVRHSRFEPYQYNI